jgi:hypothetical protein
VAGQVTVHRWTPNQPEISLKGGEYFYKYYSPRVNEAIVLIICCRLLYNERMGTFTEIDKLRENLAECHQPPDNCPVCILDEQSTTESQELPTGVARLGTNYHLRDFVLFREENGPSGIGQIDWVDFNGDHTTLSIKLLGRTSSLPGIPPTGFVKDEVCGIVTLIDNSCS